MGCGEFVINKSGGGFCVVSLLFDVVGFLKQSNINKKNGNDPSR